MEGLWVCIFIGRWWINGRMWWMACKCAALAFQTLSSMPRRPKACGRSQYHMQGLIRSQEMSLSSLQEVAEREEAHEVMPPVAQNITHSEPLKCYIVADFVSFFTGGASFKTWWCVSEVAVHFRSGPAEQAQVSVSH